jgi:hypothetical protein
MTISYNNKDNSYFLRIPSPINISGIKAEFFCPSACTIFASEIPL